MDNSLLIGYNCISTVFLPVLIIHIYHSKVQDRNVDSVNKFQDLWNLMFKPQNVKPNHCSNMTCQNLQCLNFVILKQTKFRKLRFQTTRTFRQKGLYPFKV